MSSLWKEKTGEEILKDIEMYFLKLEIDSVKERFFVKSNVFYRDAMWKQVQLPDFAEDFCLDEIQKTYEELYRKDLLSWLDFAIPSNLWSPEVKKEWICQTNKLFING